MRVLLIEDDEAFRMGIEAFLTELPGVEGVIVAADGEQGLEQLGRVPCDLAVLDIGLPGLGGLETCRRIKAGFDIPVLILTSQEDERWVRRMWEAGASGYLHKSETQHQLELALRSVAGGASWWDRQASRSLRAPEGAGEPGGGEARDRHLAALTTRERQVLEAMAEGLTNQQIAARLGIGAGTVRIHVSAVFQKLGVSNRTQAVLVLLRARPGLR
jgi:two-component system NarL family response regulator